MKSEKSLVNTFNLLLFINILFYVYAKLAVRRAWKRLYDDDQVFAAAAAGAAKTENERA